MSAHTPGPWRYVRLNGTAKDFDIVSANGGRVASTPYENHARLIVNAVNNYASLIAMLDALVVWVWPKDEPDEDGSEPPECVQHARAALAKAKGEA